MIMALGQRRNGADNALRLPVVLGVVSLFVLMVFQTGEAIHDRGALAEVRRAQEPTVQEAVRLRQQLEALAGQTAKLATDGDEGAKGVVEQMKRQGVTLNPPKQ
jgi:hypothetical protein